jgi:hypothetical protein
MTSECHQFFDLLLFNKANMYYDELTGIYFSSPNLLIRLHNCFKTIIGGYLGLVLTIAEMEYLRKEATYHYKQAKKYADKGDRSMVECFVCQIKYIQKKVNVELGSLDFEIDIDKEQQQILNSIEGFFINLEMAVESDNKGEIEWYSDFILKYSCKINLDIAERLDKAKIKKEKNGQENGQKFIEKAKIYAEKGDEILMSYFINKAKDFQIDVPQIVVNKEAESKFIQNEIESIFKSAIKNAKKGDKAAMNYNINSIYNYAKQIGTNVNHLIQLIDKTYDDFKYSKSY